MSRKIPALYDVCECNHEAMLHLDRTKKCFFDVPIGQKLYRGLIKFGAKTELCGCKKFKFNQKNTANPKPSGDNHE